MRTAQKGGDTDAFVTALDALRTRGSSVLVVGRDRQAHSVMCRRLFGAGSESGPGSEMENRYRLLVLTEAACCSTTWETIIGSGAETETVQTRVLTRTDDLPAVGTSTSVARISPQLLSSLGTAVAEAVASFQTDAGGLEPAQVRLCLDSVRPLLVKHDPKSVFRLLHMLTTQMRQVRGLGQYHLPLDRDHNAVRLLEPLFDAVVEVRVQEGQSEQRWHLRDQGIHSEWVPLTERDLEPK